MSLVPAKCPQCGAGVTIDDSQDAAICEYCRAPFIVEKAINQYNITNAQIHADTINVSMVRDFDIVGGTLNKYIGSATDVVIPYGVVEIAPEAFAGLGAITSVIIPDTVKSIGRPRTMLSQRLQGSFEKCVSLKKVNIPNSVEYIMELSFYGCPSLEEIDISTDKAYSLGLDQLAKSFHKCPGIFPVATKILEQHAANGTCWSCNAPLVLKRNRKCKACGAKNHFSYS